MKKLIRLRNFFTILFRGKLIYEVVFLAVAVIALIILIRLSNAEAKDSTMGNIHPPDEKGPYDVGFRIFENIPVSGGGTLTRIQVYYPVDPIDPTFDPTNCPNIYTIQGVGGFFQRSSPLCAVQNAPVASGIFKMVVHDHGGGPAGADHQRISQLSVHENLASHGMIVVAIRHSANAVARVLDVPKVIDYMVDPSNPLSGSIDPDHVGMSGFSTGGRTSLAVTGGWAAPPNNAPPILADPRIVAMVLYEPGRDNTLEDVATISIPYLVLGGTRSTNAVDVIPELFDTTVLATPRIRVLNPEAIHFNYQTDVCEQIEETREAAWDLPGQQIEPLTNLITLYPNNDPSQPCLKIPGTEICRRVCNTGQQGPAGPPPLVGAAAIHACTFWNQGELMAFNLGFIQGFAFGGGRNICNRIGVDSDQSLDTHPEDEFTDAFLGGDPLIPLFEGNDQFNSNELTPELPLTEEVIVPMVKLYTVAFFKKYLEDDGRYMRYLTPGYANVHNLEAIVMIIGEDEEE